MILDCTDVVTKMCYDVDPLLKVIKLIISILQWSVPALLIVLGTIDMFKAVVKANDEKVVQEAKKSLIRRLIYGVIIFLVPFFVELILGLVADMFPSENDEIGATSWISCWTGEVDTSSCDDIFEENSSNTETNDYDDGQLYCWVYKNNQWGKTNITDGDKCDTINTSQKLRYCWGTKSTCVLNQ